MINPAWAVAIVGVVIAGTGVTLIVFRKPIIEFMLTLPLSSPRNTATAIGLGGILALFGAVAIWSGVAQLLAAL